MASLIINGKASTVAPLDPSTGKENQLSMCKNKMIFCINRSFKVSCRNYPKAINSGKEREKDFI